MKKVFESYKDKFEFGKYKGKSLHYVLNTAPDYLDWALENKVIDITNTNILSECQEGVSIYKEYIKELKVNRL